MWMIFFLWDIICFCTTFWWPDGVTHSLSRLKRDNLPGGSSALQQVRVPVHYVVTVVLLFYIIYEKKTTIYLLSGSESEWPAVRGGLSKVSYGNHAFNLVHMIGSFVLIQFFFFSLFVATHKKGKTICHNKTYKPITLVKNDASLTQFWYLEAIAYTTTMIVCSYMF